MDKSWNSDRNLTSLIPAYAPFDPMARKFSLELTKPTLEDPTGDVERLLLGLQAAWPEMEPDRVAVPLRIVQRVSRTIRDASFRVTVVLARTEDMWELIDVADADSTHDAEAGRCYGLGVDVGTTTLSLYLVDMVKGEIAAELALDNPQGVHGEDILTRIHYCQLSRGLDTLRKLVVDCINGGMFALAAGQELAPQQIYAVGITGNPAMMHLLLGFDPYYVCREPYVPVFNRPLFLKAGELLLHAHPDAPVYMFPSLGSYFGGDIVAGILASGMHRKSEVSLLVDVGTNAEIVLGNNEWLVACAGAAGPALEAGGVKSGMRAGSGAIARVRINKDNLEPQVEVIGGGQASGICGSGLIDLVAELYLAEAIDAKGRVRDCSRSKRIRSAGAVKGYAVALAERREASEDVVVDELDIGSFLKAKGAMYTALTLITERMGVRFEDLEAFYVGGSFGENIDPRSAVITGMLPDIPLDRFKSLGNCAGLGACMMLCSYHLRKDIEEIRAKTTHTQLTTDNEFFSRLNAAVFIPHTERELFPSVP